MNFFLLGGVAGRRFRNPGIAKTTGGLFFGWVRLSQPKLIPTPIYALFIGCRVAQLHSVDAKDAFA